MSTDQVESIVSVSHRGLHLGLSPKRHYSNSSTSPSNYPSSGISDTTDGEANSSSDINMLEFCISQGSSVDNACNATLPQGEMNQTFIATPVKGSRNFWNENLSLMHNQETALEKYDIFHKNSEEESKSSVTTPDSAGGESQLSSCDLSRRGSLENSSYSLSSGEMVMRNNSFCLEDQSLLVVSSLDESSISQAVAHSALPVASNLLSTTLPDVCEKPTERIVEESHPCLSVTFINTDDWEILTEENEMASNSLVTLPDENKHGLLMTFVCETSSEDSGREAKFPSEADLSPHIPKAITPDQGKVFVSPMQETDTEIHTSTPVQNIGNKISSLPSFLSPCTGNLSVVAGLEVQKMQMNRVPNSGFSGIESKVVTRIGPQLSVLSPHSQLKWSQIRPINKRIEANKGSAFRISPIKVNGGPTLTTKMATSAQKQVNKGVGNLDITMIQSTGHTVDGQGNNRAIPMGHHPSSKKHISAVQYKNAKSEAVQVTPSQEVHALEKHSGKQISCFSSLEKFSDRSGQRYLKPTPKKGMSEKIEVKSGSALCQDRTQDKTRPRFSSESSSSSSRPPSFTILKADIHPSQTRAGNPKCSLQNKRVIQTEALNRSTEDSAREFKKISLVTESSKSTSQGTSKNETKSKFRRGPSPRRKEASLSQSLGASHKPATPSTSLRQGTLGRDGYRISRPLGTPPSKPKNPSSSQRGQARGDPALGNGSGSSAKHQLNGCQPPQTPTRPSIMGPPTTASKLPRKTPRTSRTLTKAGVHSELGEGGRNAQVSGGGANKSTPLKSVLKARHFSTPGKSIQPTLTAACKPAASTSKRVASSTVTPSLKTTPAKFVCLASSGPVDKSKSKVSSWQQRPQQKASQPNQSNRPPDVVPASAAEVERKNHKIQQLKGLLASSNCRFEAVTIVLQQSLAKSDEATRQSRELSQELVDIRGELVCSVQSSECLEKEKEELRLTLEDALQKLQEQHQKDLTELEQRLQAFYQAEWDKVQLAYQEEADKCKALMQQQVGELESSHEAKKLELQSSHAEQLQGVKQHYEMSLEELRKIHNEDLQSLENTLKHVEASLSGQIEKLTVENNSLIEKLTAEENKRKEMAETSQKDSRTLYLEQELESLKVVLDMKTKQLHQQEKKLIEMDKLTDKNVKLDESLKKVQQENEDLKARMERHAALSRQLSTEQAMLQESLQKESKVNKRLSMENEELLWKLHNGDLSSPRKVSPTSTSPLHSPPHYFGLQSPHSPSPPVSPR